MVRSFAAQPREVKMKIDYAAELQRLYDAARLLITDADVQRRQLRFDEAMRKAEEILCINREAEQEATSKEVKQE